MFNEGSGTATDIDVTLRFPPSVKLIKYTDFPARPAAPAPPNSPYRNNVEDLISRSYLDLPHLQGINDGDASIYDDEAGIRSEEHTSELQSLMRISYAVFCLKKQNNLPANSTISNKTVLHTHQQNN